MDRLNVRTEPLLESARARLHCYAAQIVDELRGRSATGFDRHVDVRSEARRAVKDRRLRAEKVPAHAETIERARERAEKLSDRLRR